MVFEHEVDALDDEVVSHHPLAAGPDDNRGSGVGFGEYRQDPWKYRSGNDPPLLTGLSC